MPIIQSSLTLIPGNGQSINIWTYSILGMPPLGFFEEISCIKQWLVYNDCTKFADFSEWTTQGMWQGWKHFQLLEDLKEEEIFCIHT
jgi:hypothetical protein